MNYFFSYIIEIDKNICLLILLYMSKHNKNPILDPNLAQSIAHKYGTPIYIYSEEKLRKYATSALGFPNAYGLSVRFAMKACPNKNIISLFNSLGLKIDASSVFEVYRAINAGVKPKNISLSAQEIPHDLEEVLNLGIDFNACSLKQIEAYGRIMPNSNIGIRFNPGAGSGGNNRTNVGGVSSSFGIWHEYYPEVKTICEKYNLTVNRIHTHIGSGSDPKVWLKVALMNFEILKKFETASILNLGGGYKVGRVKGEETTNLQLIGEPVKEEFIKFKKNTGRKIHLEIEPGTYLTANAGSLLAEVHDIVNTGENGYNFIKLNTGMTELLRPSLYGAQHPLYIFKNAKNSILKNSNKSYVVVGHCCESGDILTPEEGQPELLSVRELDNVGLGDLVLIGGTGAYASSMATKNYNSYPEAPELIINLNNEPVLIRKKQHHSEIWKNEI